MGNTLQGKSTTFLDLELNNDLSHVIHHPNVMKEFLYIFEFYFHLMAIVWCWQFTMAFLLKMFFSRISYEAFNQK